MQIGDLVLVNEEYCMEKDYLAIVVEEDEKQFSYASTKFKVVPVDKQNKIPAMWVSDIHVLVLSGGK